MYIRMQNAKAKGNAMGGCQSGRKQDGGKLSLSKNDVPFRNGRSSVMDSECIPSPRSWGLSFPGSSESGFQKLEN